MSEMKSDRKTEKKRKIRNNNTKEKIKLYKKDKYYTIIGVKINLLKK